MIQTPVIEGDNILTQEGLLEHVTILEQIAEYKVNVAGEYVFLSSFYFTVLIYLLISYFLFSLIL